MKTLHRFILRSYLPPFLMTFVISVFVLFMQFLWKWVDELVGKGLDTHVVIELFCYAALSTVPLALPMAVLLSSLMMFGNLAENYELAALKASGISLFRISRPLIVCTAGIAVGAFLFSNYLLPYTNLKMLSTLFDIRHQKPAMNIKEGVFYDDIDGYSLRISKIGKDGQTLRNVMVYDHTDQMGNTQLTLAETGKMYMSPDQRYLMIELYNGNTYRDVWNQQNAATRKPFMRMHFTTQQARLDLSGFEMQKTDEDLFKDNHQMLNGQQLLSYIDTMKMEINDDRVKFFTNLSNGYLSRTKKYFRLHDSLKTAPGKGSFLLNEFEKQERQKVYEVALNTARNSKSACESKVNELKGESNAITRFRIEFWRKFTLSVACLIMFFIGAPLGAIIRKGGLGMPVVISVVCFILFWVLSITGEKLSKEGTLPPQWGMWLGCAVFLPLGIWLTRKATADAPLFESENYQKVLGRIGKLIPVRKKKTQPEAKPANPFTHDDQPDEN
ncbi:MAG: LptF/LptG family permease [Bacteroidia bacterium]|nr:LptF/LptG family permease [Bacteroidia bacterium]